MRRKVKYIIIFSLFILGGFFSTAGGTIIADGIITGDTVWTNSDIIEITAEVEVTSTGHLTIEPGTTIRIALLGEINVYGLLTAIGSETDRILFTAMADTVNGSPGPAGIWYGVSAWEGGRLEMSYCDIRYALSAVSITQGSGDFSNCIAENFLGYGFLIDGINSIPRIEVNINSCRIIQTNPSMMKKAIGIYTLRSANVSVANTEVSDCQLGIKIYSNNTSSPLYSIKRSEISHNDSLGINVIGTG